MIAEEGNNLYIEVKRPHAMSINVHPVNRNVFAINFAQEERFAGRLKVKGGYPLAYIDAHLNVEEAQALLRKLKEFIEDYQENA